MRANRAKSIVNNTQEKLDREMYNEKAGLHNYPKMKKPLSELFPKQAFNERLLQKAGPSIHEKDPRKVHKVTLEETMINKIKDDHLKQSH